MHVVTLLAWAKRSTAQPQPSNLSVAWCRAYVHISETYTYLQSVNQLLNIHSPKAYHTASQGTYTVLPSLPCPEPPEIIYLSSATRRQPSPLSPELLRGLDPSPHHIYCAATSAVLASTYPGSGP